MREDAGGLQEAAGDTKARNALHLLSERLAASLDDAETSICAGRIDFEAGETLYIGRRGIRDADGTHVVINWRADAARPFFEAGPNDPRGLDRRRRFRLNGRTLAAISDDLFTARYEHAAPEIIDILLEELERKRGSEMHDIVATIQADQYRLITQPLAGALVVQGGPGTGKTAVALHRAAWLLSAYRDTLTQRGVLVVGPNPTFMRYIARVLPSLDEDSVDQASVSNLVRVARARATDEEPLMRLKGDPRMATVISRAVERRVRPAAGPFRLTLEGHSFELTVAEMRDAAKGVLMRNLSYMEGRNQYRTAILHALYEAYRKVAAPTGRIRGPQEFDSRFRGASALQNLLDRTWPSTSSRELVRDLLQGPRILADAAGDVLSSEEQQLLLRRPVDRIDDVRWTDSDLALLDEAESILQGVSERWGHVIVDESQDLTPMQLRMVSRRTFDGSMTLAGDIAQATGPWSYADWESVAEHLVAGADANIHELTRGYRVAEEVMTFAARLLPEIAPGATAPVAYRPGAGEPSISRTDAETLLAKLVEVVKAVGEGDGTVAVIVPPGELRRTSGALDAAGIEFGEAVNGLSQPIEVLTPRHAKGLEFDDVIVLEPRSIAEDGVNGLRELYVALTRATQQLHIVHSRGLPLLLETEPGAPPADAAAAAVDGADRARMVDSPLAAPEPPDATKTHVSGLTEAFALARLAASDDRPLSQRLMAAALVLGDGGTHDEAVAALLLPGASDRTQWHLSEPTGTIVRQCVEARASNVADESTPQPTLRVLLADGVASVRSRGGLTESDTRWLRRLVKSGRDTGTPTGLALDLDTLLADSHGQ